MILKSTRTKNELSEVLKDPKAEGPEVAYWVYSRISRDKWENMTVIAAGTYNGEFNKTYGHYHTTKVMETYKIIHGEGVLQLQRKHYDQNSQWVSDMVDEVFLVKFGKDDEVGIIPDDYGHAWSNVGKDPLISLDDWRSGHMPFDYEPIKELKGLCYYIIEKDGNIELVENPNYKTHPTPKWVTPEELNFYMLKEFNKFDKNF